MFLSLCPSTFFSEINLKRKRKDWNKSSNNLHFSQANKNLTPTNYWAPRNYYSNTIMWNINGGFLSCSLYYKLFPLLYHSPYLPTHLILADKLYMCDCYGESSKRGMKATTFNRDLSCHEKSTKIISLSTGRVALEGIEECVKGSENSMPVFPHLVMTEVWEAPLPLPFRVTLNRRYSAWLHISALQSGRDTVSVAWLGGYKGNYPRSRRVA